MPDPKIPPRRASARGMRLLLAALFLAAVAHAGVPVTHVMICCQGSASFLLNGKWNANPDFKDIDQASDMLQKIKDAGIDIVIVDMTNEAQWDNAWNEFSVMVDNIQAVCERKKLQFAIFLGAQVRPLSYWNRCAGKILTRWANKPTYRAWGFDGDNRPLLVEFLPGQSYWAVYNAAPDSAKTDLSKFHIGTTIVNDPATPQVSDGWGYRDTFQSSDGKVRYASPTKGLYPPTVTFGTGAEWLAKVQWCAKAEYYSVYGSYDDAWDAQNWGIARMSSGKPAYAGDDPNVYYDVLRNFLARSAALRAGNVPAQMAQRRFRYSLLGKRIHGDAAFRLIDAGFPR